MPIEQHSTPTNQSSLRELVQRAQAGDRAAWHELYLMFKHAVLRWALRKLPNYADACELVQEVFLQAWRHIKTLRQPERFGGWLKTIARRMASTHRHRRRRMRVAHKSSLNVRAGEADDPVAASMRREKTRVVHEALAQLGHQDQQALESFYLESQSVQQMSHNLRVPEGTIKRRLHVARHRLAAKLKGVVV
jgi:RNA polymerase sigma-70 factor (ECF subfamily)